MQNGYCRGSVTINITASDPGGFSINQISGTIAGGAFSAAGSSYSTIITAQGSGSATFTAYSASGRTASGSLSWNIDSVAPTAAWRCNGAACSTNWYGTPVSMSIAATDSTSGIGTTSIYINGTAGSTVGEGEHIVTGRVCDVAGNCTDLPAITVRVDSVAPDASWRCNGAACSTNWYGTPVSMSIAATDSTSGIGTTSIFVDSAASSTVGEGEHAVTGEVCDAAGNCTDLPAITVSVDITPPDIALQAPVILLGGSNLVIATDAMSGLAAITVEITGNGITPRVFVFTNPTGPVVVNWDGLDGNGNEIPYGAYTITATARDLAGNVSTTSGLWVRPQPPTATPIIWTRTPTETPSATPEPRKEESKETVVGLTATPSATATPEIITPVVYIPPAVLLPFALVFLPLFAVLSGITLSKISLFNDSRWSQTRTLFQDIARFHKTHQGEDQDD